MLDFYDQWPRHSRSARTCCPHDIRTCLKPCGLNSTASSALMPKRAMRTNCNALRTSGYSAGLPSHSSIPLVVDISMKSLPGRSFALSSFIHALHQSSPPKPRRSANHRVHARLVFMRLTPDMESSVYLRLLVLNASAARSDEQPKSEKKPQ